MSTINNRKNNLENKSIETSEFFKRDVEEYCKLAEFYILDAVVLSLGESPKEAKKIIQTEAYNTRFLLLLSHIDARSIPSRKTFSETKYPGQPIEVYVLNPLDLINLLEKLREPYPEELKYTIREYRNEIPQKQYGKIEEENKLLKIELKKINIKNKVLEDRTSSKNKMILAMAIKQYAHKPNASKNSSTKNIANATAEIFDSGLSEETVLDHLREAKSLLPKDENTTTSA